MKKISKLISFVLVISIFLQIVEQPILAIEYNSMEIESKYLKIENYNNVGQVFEDLSDEAKEIFLEYMIKSDKELLDYHRENVNDINSKIIEKQLEKKINKDEIYKLKSSAVNDTGMILKLLSSKLNALNLGKEVVYALMGVASSMLASAASLGASTIFSILVAAGCSAVIIANWSKISNKWDKITKAFQDSFRYGYSSVILGGFNKAKSSYTSDYGNIMAIDYVIKSAPINTKECQKHLSIAIVEKTKRQNNYEIYYSPSRKVALIKYKLGFGIKADVNKTWAPSTNYSEINYDVSGATLFLLYDFNKRHIFHAHIRIFGSPYINEDTITMRKSNNLTWRVKPFPMRYDKEYENTKTGAYFRGNQVPGKTK